jgi:mono/diheme cytochrome c family protein
VAGRSFLDAAEAALSEVPEHLMARSRARRAAMGGGGGDAAAAPVESAAPATTGDAAPAPVAAAATPAVPAAPKVPDPVPPWVEAAQTRRKIPVWAVPVLVMLPLWAVVYALTLDEPTPTELGPLELGAEVYAGQGCSGCHGAGGAGAGAVPALNNVAVDFESPADMVTWVALGSAGYQAAGIEEYAPGKPVNGGMPPWMDTLDAEELMSVVLHERTEFGEEEFDAAVWEEGWEETLAERLPADKVAEYTAVLEEWAADPPA